MGIGRGEGGSPGKSRESTAGSGREHGHGCEGGVCVGELLFVRVRKERRTKIKKKSNPTAHRAGAQITKFFESGKVQNLFSND